MVWLSDTELFAWTVALAATPNTGLISEDFGLAVEQASRAQEGQVSSSAPPARLKLPPQARAVAVLMRMRSDLRPEGFLDAHERVLDHVFTAATPHHEMTAGSRRPPAGPLRIEADVAARARNLVDGVLATISFPLPEDVNQLRHERGAILNRKISSKFSEVIKRGAPPVLKFLIEECGIEATQVGATYTQLLEEVAQRAERDGDTRPMTTMSGSRHAFPGFVDEYKRAFLQLGADFQYGAEHFSLLCCNKVKLSPWKGSMIPANIPLSSSPPPPLLLPPTSPPPLLLLPPAPHLPPPRSLPFPPSPLPPPTPPSLPPCFLHDSWSRCMCEV